MTTYAPNRIRQIRQSQGLTLEELSGMLDNEATPSTVAKLERSQISLTLDRIVDFARALNVPPMAIIDETTSQMRAVPIAGSIAAGNWREAVHDPQGYAAVHSEGIGENAFALRVVGDSMDKIVPEGGIIVVDPDQLDLSNRCVYAVQNGSGETTFKQFRSSPPTLEPCSTNSAHTPIAIGREPFVVLGRVVHVGFDL